MTPFSVSVCLRACSPNSRQNLRSRWSTATESPSFQYCGTMDNGCSAVWFHFRRPCRQSSIRHLLCCPHAPARCNTRIAQTDNGADNIAVFCKRHPIRLRLSGRAGDSAGFSVPRALLAAGRDRLTRSVAADRRRDRANCIAWAMNEQPLDERLAVAESPDCRLPRPPMARRRVPASSMDVIVVSVSWYCNDQVAALYPLRSRSLGQSAIRLARRNDQLPAKGPTVKGWRDRRVAVMKPVIVVMLALAQTRQWTRRARCRRLGRKRVGNL